MKIVIIGAGVAGLSIGWRLAQAGQEVTVLERAQPGAGATGASAGMIAVTAEMLEASPAEAEFARISNELWPDFAAEIEVASGRSIAYARAGALILSEEVTRLDRLARHGEVLTGARALELVPLLKPGLAGALWAPGDSRVDARALALALAIAFTKARGKLLINEAVAKIEQHGGRPAARTPFGLYQGDVLLLAAGAWSEQLDAHVPVRPVKGQMIALMPPPGVALPGPVLWGHGVYAVPRGGQLLIGATVEDAGFDTSVSDAAQDQLWAAGARMISGLESWRLVEHWAGLRPGSPDGLPLLGPLADGLCVASGQYRNGILFAPAIADMIRDQILGRAPVSPAFDPKRFGSDGQEKWERA